MNIYDRELIVGCVFVCSITLYFTTNLSAYNNLPTFLYTVSIYQANFVSSFVFQLDIRNVDKKLVNRYVLPTN